MRVFFVEEPNNGVEVVNFNDVGTFTESEPQKYYEYSGAQLGGDGILAPGETSGAKTWEFALNGATEFQFSVLVWTAVPDPGAYSVHLTRVSAGSDHTCAMARTASSTAGATTSPAGSATARGPTARLPWWCRHRRASRSRASRPVPHTCADGSDGKVYCWGLNFFGQLGDGTNDRALDARGGAGTGGRGALGRRGRCLAHLRPWLGRRALLLGRERRRPAWRRHDDRQLDPRGGAGTGGRHALGRRGRCLAHLRPRSGGKVYCWGYNADGQLGDGTDTSRLTPVAVEAPEGVVLSGVVARLYHTCAEGSDGKVYCWGWNGFGQLGDGRRPTARRRWRCRPGGRRALGRRGRWRSHLRRGLGRQARTAGAGTAPASSATARTPSAWTPVAVQAPAGVVLSGVSAGEAHTCARSTAGPVSMLGRQRLRPARQWEDGRQQRPRHRRGHALSALDHREAAPGAGASRRSPVRGTGNFFS